MFIFENDSTQNAHLSKSKNDRVNSWYENHRDPKAYERLLNSHPSFPFCKRVSHFESDLQILYPTFHFCNDFPVFFLAFMI